METATELDTTVHHLCGMLKTVKVLNKGNPKGAVADALIVHLRGLTLEDLHLEEPTAGAEQHSSQAAAA